MIRIRPLAIALLAGAWLWQPPQPAFADLPALVQGSREDDFRVPTHELVGVSGVLTGVRRAIRDHEDAGLVTRGKRRGRAIDLSTAGLHQRIGGVRRAPEPFPDHRFGIRIARGILQRGQAVEQLDHQLAFLRCHVVLLGTPFGGGGDMGGPIRPRNGTSVKCCRIHAAPSSASNRAFPTPPRTHPRKNRRIPARGGR